MSNLVQLAAVRKPPFQIDTRRYAKCVEVSKRINWDIDRDVIRGRIFDLSKDFLPEGLSKVAGLDFLTAEERTLLSQIQGRTYASMFGLVERFIGAKMIEVSGEHDAAVNDLVALVTAVDAVLRQQAKVDGTHFFDLCHRPFSPQQIARVRSTILEAYRFQYILSGAQNERFTAILGELITKEQAQRIGDALAPIAEPAAET